MWVFHADVRRDKNNAQVQFPPLIPDCKYLMLYIAAKLIIYIFNAFYIGIFIIRCPNILMFEVRLWI